MLSLPVLLLTATPSVFATSSTTCSPPLPEAEASWRFIGEKKDPSQPCPAAPSSNWNVRPLAPDAPLNDFCVYTFIDLNTTVPPTEVDLIKDLGKGDLHEVCPDRLGVIPASQPFLRDAFWPTLYSRFSEQAGKIPLPMPTVVSPVRIVVVDTSPTDGENVAGLPETSPHGETMRRVLNNLLCTPGGCVAEVRSQLALAYKEFTPTQVSDRDPIQGGSVGLIGELAEALAQAVAEWESIPVTDRPRLILNLSVGWDPSFGGTEILDTDMPPDVRAVLKILDDAVCNGALVVSAAGNLADGQGSSTGALMPAAWQEREGVCTSPLVYAVAAVGADRQLLANARPSSRPPRVAYGDHVVVPDSFGQPSAIQTGSSLAAVIASAALAAVAAYRPHLCFDQIITLVDQAGEALNQPADIFLGSGAAQGATNPGVRYLSVCEAVKAACQGEGPSSCTGAAAVTCPVASFNCSPRQAAPPTIEGVDFSDFDPNQEVTVSHCFGPGCFLGPDLISQCQDQAVYYRHPVSLDACAYLRHPGFGRAPWSAPQPNSEICPNCGLLKDSLAYASFQKNSATTASLYVEIEAGSVPNGSVITAPTLVLCPGENATTYVIPLTQNLVPGETLLVTDLYVPPSCSTALLTYQILWNNQEFSAVTPLLVASHSGPE